MQNDDAPHISIIVPTLNEERNLAAFLRSVGEQPSKHETLVIDGGSKDRTFGIAKKNNAKISVYPGYGEFISRNIGAKMAKGELLLFTCADTIFPQNSFDKIIGKFRENPQLIALTGPGYPFDAPFLGKLEYAIYNIARYLLATLPKPLKRFSTSTNFLVVKKDYFRKTGGFLVNDINADGLLGRELLNLGKVTFCLDTPIFLSARRMKKMGFMAFNKHYMYVLENIFFFASNSNLTKAIKQTSRMRHRNIHEPQH